MFIFFVWLCLPVFMYVHHVCLIPGEVRRRYLDEFRGPWAVAHGCCRLSRVIVRASALHCWAALSPLRSPSVRERVITLHFPVVLFHHCAFVFGVWTCETGSFVSLAGLGLSVCDSLKFLIVFSLPLMCRDDRGASTTPGCLFVFAFLWLQWVNSVLPLHQPLWFLTVLSYCHRAASVTLVVCSPWTIYSWSSHISLFSNHSLLTFNI